MGKKTVAIIILNWNGLDNTEKCLDSLLEIKNVNYNVIVIDNGSNNNEAEKLKKKFGSKIEVHPLPENIGFTGGMNYGIETAKKFKPEYYLLLNNDTTVDKNFLKNIIQTASSDPSIGVVSPMIYNYFHRNEIIFSGGYVNWLFGKTFHRTNKIDYVLTCKFITGCCFLIKKEVIEKIGKLDNRFFAYFEDAAFSITATKAGYKCVCDPSAVIYHKESASMEKAGPFKTYLVSRNRILFINNYAPYIVRVYFSIYNLFKLIGAMIYFNITKQYIRSIAYMKGYVDGTLGKGGKPNL